MCKIVKLHVADLAQTFLHLYPNRHYVSGQCINDERLYKSSLQRMKRESVLHKLHVYHTLTWQSIQRKERLCNSCQAEIGDEFHCMLASKELQAIRK